MCCYGILIRAVDHPFVEALALTAVDIPITFITQVLFAIVLYWMTGEFLTHKVHAHY